VSKSREIFSAAERDTEAWVRSLLPPLEVQVREQRAQLKKRAESVAKIRDAQESLDERIGQLEAALEDVQIKLDEAKSHAARTHAIAQREPVRSAAELVPDRSEAALAAYVRAEI
jgi:chromosome segregation ATPase